MPQTALAVTNVTLLCAARYVFLYQVPFSPSNSSSSSSSSSSLRVAAFPLLPGSELLYQVSIEL
jgi:hypothetical protein